MGGTWTATEELLVVQFAREHGHKWVLLHSKGFLPSRTVSGIKQRWYDTIKHKLDAKGDPTPMAAADCRCSTTTNILHTLSIFLNV
jgi:hypothetical protein